MPLAAQQHFAPPAEAVVAEATIVEAAIVEAPVEAPIVEAWRTSPYHGAIDGATGQPIPCLCRFRERDYKVGQTVCMQSLYGFMITRCDLAQNNTSWVPTPEPCASSHLPQSRRLAGHF